MTTTAKRLPIFGVPALNPDSPEFVQNLNGFAGAFIAMREFQQAAADGKFPGVALLNKVIDAIVFFVVDGDKEYAREYFAHCSLNEFLQCAKLVADSIVDYSSALNGVIDAVKRNNSIKPPASVGAVNDGE